MLINEIYAKIYDIGYPVCIQHGTYTATVHNQDQAKVIVASLTVEQLEQVTIKLPHPF